MVDHPFGINPLYFSLGLFGCLLCFVLYLLLPRGVRVGYCGAYPKRYTWNAKPRRRRLPNQPSGTNLSASGLIYGGRGSNPQTLGTNPSGSYTSSYRSGGGASANGYSAHGAGSQRGGGLGDETVNFEGSETGGNDSTSNATSRQSSSINDEAVISSAMAQLRNPGVLIVAHGSRGKPKTVRLQLTDTAITWRTETRKKNSSGHHTSEIKLGKLHSVSLTNIMYVDVGKQTTALRRVENASVPESLCFSLLTKEGSLDLEANSPRERDALISCFSLVLDEVHAQNWRDIYRGLSNDMPSSFDEYDEEAGKR